MIKNIIGTTFKYSAKILKGILASALYAYGKRRIVWYYRILLSEDFAYIITRYYKRHQVMRDVDAQYKRKEYTNENTPNNNKETKQAGSINDDWNVQESK